MTGRRITVRAAAVFVAGALGLRDLHDVLSSRRGVLTADERAMLVAEVDGLIAKRVKGSLHSHLFALYFTRYEKPTTKGEKPFIVVKSPGVRVPTVVLEHVRKQRGGRPTRGRPTRQALARTLRAIETIVRARTVHAPKVVVCLLVLYGHGWIFPVCRAMASPEFLAYATRRVDKLTRDRAKSKPHA